MVIFDHHNNNRCSIVIRNCIAQYELRVSKAVHKTTLGLRNNTIAIHWDHADADTTCPSLKEPLDITDDLNVVVDEGVVFYNH